MGAPLNLDFSRNLHGPYSDVLKKALITLEKHKLIAGLQSADRSVHVTSAGYAAADDYLKANQRDEKIIDRLSKLVDGFETPFGLELLSTVHHVATMARHEPSLSAILVRIGELDESKRPSHQYQHAISVESTAMASSFPGKNNFRQNVLNR
ncbi:hypothetical protein [Lysobacter changpingensis]|uniref:hypothetical protein n=1 Tax=Lysobacter changpingensis TaxID=2792784 RepID=UPI001A902279|nr:hypothetical protein [Lysobacter changpingensis]